MASLNECLRLVEMTCARLCHELSGLAGALVGALELAGEEAPGAHETLDFAGSAAEELVQRLRLLRAAWGPEGDPLPLAELLQLAMGLTSTRRVTIDVSGVPPQTVFAPAVGRLALNLLLLAAESLPGGGQIRLAGSADDLFVAIDGPRAAWPIGLATCLASESEAFGALTGARAIQMPLTALLAHGHRLRLALLMAPHPSGGPPPLRLGGE